MLQKVTEHCICLCPCSSILEESDMFQQVQPLTNSTSTKSGQLMLLEWQKFDYLIKNEDVWEEKIAYRHIFSLPPVQKILLLPLYKKLKIKWKLKNKFFHNGNNLHKFSEWAKGVFKQHLFCQALCIGFLNSSFFC